MSVEVVMPQMGESITEGTVSKWLKKVGERIEKDEAILEISTDKVDAEVPSPGAGTLLEIRHQEGDTVEVGTVLAVIGAEGEQPAATGGQQQPVSKPEPQPEAVINEPAKATNTKTTEQLSAANSTASTASVLPPATTEQDQRSEIQGPPSTDIIMPQMGESITEGTVSKWLKAVGERIEKDEPLLEISTDKVDAEVPSPAAGTLLEIVVNEGETVEVGAVLARVGAEGAVISQPHSNLPRPQPVVEAAKAEPVQGRTAAACDASCCVRRDDQTAGNGRSATLEELRRTKSSPLVRNIAREHGIDITRIPGSGISGRVTKNDIMSFIESGAALRPQDLLRKDAPSRRCFASGSGTTARDQEAGIRRSAAVAIARATASRKCR